MNKYVIVAFFIPVILIISCKGRNEKKSDIDIPVENQESLYRKLSDLTGNSVNVATDSVAFLVLPLEASCPSCRDKTIDSILKVGDNLNYNRFIILSSKSGRKVMNSYFRKRNGELPNIPGRLFLDSNNMANDYKLYDNNPAIYYAHNMKVYKKVLALPATIKQDLREYFLAGRSHFNTAKRE